MSQLKMNVILEESTSLSYFKYSINFKQFTEILMRESNNLCPIIKKKKIIILQDKYRFLQ